MMTIKTFIRNLTPGPVLSGYHWLLAQLANMIYGQPSEKMTVIGITGTSGKSTTCEILWTLLTKAGYKTGLASGIRFDNGRESLPNNTKMTMVGRFRLQRLLRQMVNNGCRYAIIEVTSLGISQFRHLGINFDLVLLTNFWSEHDTAHGGLANYRAAKGKLFATLANRKYKKFSGALQRKISITNADDENYKFFSAFPADEKLAFSLRRTGEGITQASQIKLNAHGSSFLLRSAPCELPLLGEHNVYNAVAASTSAQALGLELTTISSELAQIQSVPGRLEFISAGQDFTVIVDYAFEPKAMAKLYEVIKQLPHNKIIHVLGTTGGGRDAQRGAILGGMAADFADYVIATDEDPYDDDPMKLIQRVATGAQNKGKELDKNLFIKAKRLDGITKAIDLAQTGDIVLITGKGSEGTMAVANGKKIPWDDREAARAAIQNRVKIN